MGTSDEPGAGGELAAVTAPSTLLLCAPALSRGHDACPAVGRDGGEPGALLVVALNDTLERLLDDLRGRERLPETVSVITCETTRSVAGRSGIATDGTGVATTIGRTTVYTTTVSDPGNLTAIGLAVERCLSSCAARADRVDVCFDSLTTLLHYVDTRQAFRFLHALLPAIDGGGGVAHFHVDPAAHDERTRATVRSLFDAAFEYDDEDGTWRSDG